MILILIWIICTYKDYFPIAITYEDTLDDHDIVIANEEADSEDILKFSYLLTAPVPGIPAIE